MTDNETDTEEEPGYQTEGEEGPVQNDLKEVPRTMATQETNSFEDIPSNSRPPTPMTFEPQMNPYLPLKGRCETDRKSVV